MTIGQHLILLASLFVVGACLGSFLNVCIYRLPEGLSLLRPPSRCPGCSTRILARDNLPIVGWLRLRGRCRSCRIPISPRYPIVEVAVGCLPVLAYLALIPLGYTEPIEIDPTRLAAWLLGWLLGGSFAIGTVLMMADGMPLPTSWLSAGWFALAASIILPISPWAFVATLAMAVVSLGLNPARKCRGRCPESTRSRSGFTLPTAGD